MKYFKLYLLVLMLSFIVVLTGCSKDVENANAKEKPEVIRLAHIYPENSVKGKAAEMYANKIQKKTHNNFKIEVYPASQLGGDEVLAQDVSRGTLDMSFINHGSLSGMDKMMDFQYLPFIANNYNEADKLFYGNGIIPTLTKKTLLEHNMVTLGFFENEFRGVSTSDKDIKNLEDLKDQKIRVPGSKSIQGFFNNAGAQTEVMPFNELYMGLQQGTIDGQDNGLMLTYESRLHEVNKHYTLLNHVYATGTIVINQDKYKSLTKEQQKHFKDVGKEVEKWQIKENRKETKRYIEDMKAEGVKFTELTPDEKKKMQSEGRKQWKNYEDLYGKENIRKLQKEISAIHD